MDHKYMDQYIRLGQNITYYREQRGYTRAEFARRVGVSYGHLGNVEKARSGSSFYLLFLIARELGIPVRKLVEPRD